jgi:hypothetical protein
MIFPGLPVNNIFLDGKDSRTCKQSSKNDLQNQKTMLAPALKTSGKNLKIFFVGEDSMTYAKTWL